MTELSKSNPELEKLGNFLEKYIEVMKDEVSHYDEKSKEKKKLEEKIEKAQSYLDKIKISENSDFVDLGQPKRYWGSTEGLDKPLCERYEFLIEERQIILDIPHSLLKELKVEIGKDVPYPFHLSSSVLEKEGETKEIITIEKKEEIFIQKPLVGEETNTGKIAGSLGGAGTGAAGGAALGAGLMVLAAPYTFGLSLSLVPAAAGIGAAFGAVGGVTTGLAVGSITDTISNSEIAETKKKIKEFLEDYKTMMEKKSQDYQDIINNESSTTEKKEESQKQKENYDNEVREIEAYIENSNWK